MPLYYLAGVPGGSNTQLQYNAAGVFGGISGATTDGTTVTLTSPRIVTSILDTNGSPLEKYTATASAVYGLTLSNAALLGTVALGVTPPTQVASGVAGTPISITASAAVAGASNAGAVAGGAVTLASGAAARRTSGNANGGNIVLSTGAGIGTGAAGVVIHPDGVSGAPGMAFTDGTTGFFKQASGVISIGGDLLRISQAGGGVSFGGNNAVKWFTGGAYAAVNVALQPAGASTPRLEVNNGTLTTYMDLIVRQLFAGGDNAGLASSTSLTNTTAVAGANAYIIQGGQAATTVNTGWIKIYVGTTVCWIPYWANATP